MSRSKQFSLIFFLLLLGTNGFAPSTIAAQNGNKQTLTTHLKELNRKYGERISFSPTVTDEIRPHNQATSGTLREALDKLLQGTGLGFKAIGRYYYLYAKEAAPVFTLPPKKLKKPEVKPKTFPPIAPSSILAVFPSQKNVPVLRGHRPAITPIYPKTPKIAVKTNLLYDATSTFNLGIELGLSNKWTLDISGNFNPWTFSGGRKMKHWLVQPEARYWLCERFNGHFLGVHAHGAQYNWGGMLPWGFKNGKMLGVESKELSSNRYQGWLIGAGASYGYQWILGNRWSLEATLGLGYAYLNYDKYPCGTCGTKIKSDTKNYFGPTKIAMSLIYTIK